MKKMTKVFSFLMAAALVFSAVPAVPAIAAEAEAVGAAAETENISAEAEAVETEKAETEVEAEANVAAVPTADLQATGGDVGDLKWTLDDAGTLTISGNGSLPWYSVPWEEQKANIKKLVVEEGVTGASTDHFQNMPNLTEAKLANSLTSLGMNAFQGCSSLRSVNIPADMSTVGMYAFAGCTALESVTIPEGPETIDQFAFQGCTGLKSIRFPASVYTISYYAFSNCTSLAEVVFLNDDIDVWSGAFDNTPWKESQGDFFIINGKLLGYSGTSTEVVIPDTVTIITSEAFYENTEIRKVTIPDSVQKIEGGAFEDCTNLEEVIMADSGIKLSSTSFRNTPWVRSLGDFFIYDNVLYDYNGSSAEVTIPDGVTSIGYDCFTYGVDYGITKLTMPDSLTDFGYDSIKGLYNCLRSVTLPNSLEAVPQMAFSDFEKLEEVIIGNNTTTIYGAAFRECSSLKTIVLPDSLYSIGEQAFSGCSSLEEITIPAGVGVIWDAAFYGCYSLKKLTILTRDYYFRGGDPFSGYDGPAYGEDLTIYGYEGTEAQEVAELYGIPFVPFDFPAEKVTLSETSLELSVNETRTLQLIVEPENYTDDVTWKSSNTSVATVTNKGVVRGIGTGNAVITVTVGNLSASCSVTVKSQPATDIYFMNSGDEWPTDRSFALIAHIVPETATDYTVTWSSSNTKVATVDNGLVTVKTYGTAIITAKLVSAGITKTASYEVKALFNDVMDKTKYWFKPVYWAADHEPTITNGYDGGVYFGPELNCTREQLITFLYREAGQPTVTAADIKKYKFKDVIAGKYYEKPVVWAAKNGITKGYSDGTFGVSKTVTREDTVTFLYRMAKAVAGSKFKDVTAADLKNQEFAFKDVASGKYYQKPIVWAAKNGITKGYSSGEHKGKFGVGFNVLRGDIVTFLYRYDGKFN